MPRSTDGCDACPIAPTRRDFLRDVPVAIAAIVASLGLSRNAAAQMPVSWTTAIKSVNAARTFPIPPADGAQIDKKNEIILVRWQQSMYAFNLSCPHQNTALRWDANTHRFQCPKHHSRYEPNGTFIDGRATRGMDRLTIALDGANITVDLDHMHKQDVDPAGWAAAVVHIP